MIEKSGSEKQKSNRPSTDGETFRRIVRSHLADAKFQVSELRKGFRADAEPLDDQARFGRSLAVAHDWPFGGIVLHRDGKGANGRDVVIRESIGDAHASDERSGNGFAGHVRLQSS